MHEFPKYPENQEFWGQTSVPLYTGFEVEEFVFLHDFPSGWKRPKCDNKSAIGRTGIAVRLFYTFLAEARLRAPAALN